MKQNFLPDLDRSLEPCFEMTCVPAVQAVILGSRFGSVVDFGEPALFAHWLRLKCARSWVIFIVLGKAHRKGAHF